LTFHNEMVFNGEELVAPRPTLKLEDHPLSAEVRVPTTAGIFLFITASRPALGPTQPLIQWVPGALSQGIKLLGREADHSTPSSAEVKECVWSYTSTSPIRLHGMVLS
jgi:hypothetical protein